jgi:hypothetical protein
MWAWGSTAAMDTNRKLIMAAAVSSNIDDMRKKRAFIGYSKDTPVLYYRVMFQVNTPD